MTAAPAPLPEPLALVCDLCGTALDAGGSRCSACGLYRGGFAAPSPATATRLVAAFVAVYFLTIIVVLLAR